MPPGGGAPQRIKNAFEAAAPAPIKPRHSAKSVLDRDDLLDTVVGIVGFSRQTVPDNAGLKAVVGYLLPSRVGIVDFPNAIQGIVIEGKHITIRIGHGSQTSDCVVRVGAPILRPRQGAVC